MPNTPYENIPPGELILRDRLAVDRTVLANERTFLAFLRTALTFGIGGATFIHFFDSGVTTVVGWILIPLGVAAGAVGLLRFLQYSRRIRHLR